MFSAYFDPRLEIVGKIVWFEVFFGAEILEHHSFQRVFLRATEGFQLVASEFSRFYLWRFVRWKCFAIFGTLNELLNKNPLEKYSFRYAEGEVVRKRADLVEAVHENFDMPFSATSVVCKLTGDKSQLKIQLPYEVGLSYNFEPSMIDATSFVQIQWVLMSI